MIATNETPEDLTIDRIEYIYTNPGCGDDSEIHSVREWLHDFNISEADDFFFKWQKTVLKLRTMFRRIEKETSKDIMRFVWSASFVKLYLNYNMSQEFMPQLEENAQELMTLLQMTPLDEGEKVDEQEQQA